MEIQKLIAVALLVIMGAEARSEVKTDLTIDSVQVVGMGDKWEITVTGKMSLAAEDTLTSYKFFFTGPSGKEVSPVFRPFNPPQPGETSTYSCLYTTHLKGSWTFSGEISCSIGGKKNDKIFKMKKFDVPQK